MKHIILFLISLFNMVYAQTSTDLYEYTFRDINGNEVALSSFKGKKMLLVNVASECGYTPQYKELQELHETYGNELVLIGFPCNQFGGQEPASEIEIQAFCERNFGVTFLLSTKIEVKGDHQHPIYQWLTNKELNGVEESSIRWNFEKYLIDENGHYVAHFKSGVKPLSEEIISLIK